jgi:adenine deaminase
MESFISKLPKAELHVHVLGTMSVDLCIQIAQRNQIQVDPKDIMEQRRSSYNDLSDFIKEFNFCSSLLRNKQDFYDVAYNYFLVCHKENILYTELSFSTSYYYDFNLSFSTIFEAYLEASEFAEKNLNVKSNWILCFIRHIPLEKNLRMLKDSVPYKDKIICIGLAGEEIGYPSKMFTGLFEEAKKIGYKNFTAHSGEEGDPSLIIDTLCYLKVTRIDHGVRCLEDPFLVKFLAENGIWLTVCPLSNLFLKVLDRFFHGKHVIQQLIHSRLKFTINSDDPTLLGGYLNQNYMTVAESLNENSQDYVKQVLVDLAKNSFRASFLTQAEKENYEALIDAYVASDI